MFGEGGHLIFSINVYIFHVTLYLGSMYTLLFHGRSLWAVYNPLNHVVISEKKGKKKRKEKLTG